MFSIHRSVKKPLEPKTSDVIVCRLDIPKHTAIYLAQQLASSDSFLNNGTWVQRTDKGAWYEIDRSLVMYYAESE